MRRRADARARKGKKSFAPTVLLWLSLLAVLLVVLMRTVFVVREVRLVGQVSVGSEQLVRTADVGFGRSIFKVDRQTIAAHINTLGTIAVDEVEVEYPDTIIIHVRERKPCAMLLHMGKLRILDEQGYVISEESNAPSEDMVYVNGMRVIECVQGSRIRAQAGQCEAYAAVMSALVERGASEYISEINLEEPQSIQLVTRTGIRVRLGDSSNMDAKVALMKGTLRDLEYRNEGGGVLDVINGSKADYYR